MLFICFIFIYLLYNFIYFIKSAIYFKKLSIILLYLFRYLKISIFNYGVFLKKKRA